ncbi:mitochondrial outer membrane protein porin of 36 kDa-like [Selaginella moellendorffii]|uniref:mitochondrial outer membrane protein porin of 36 kDa-like n=1 Tax=Selaginella moellendorffii TaxID=88036 RepID=UPI000D1CC6F0|nr:mitochondrial outer membrane protein porin of 36 kDa-like [Selaginella moellendorffii]|eukprot:XP_024537917.1 mitochondrial outer membrane protein porin of 36 kDa-like [Selaginella moellendorffii]
MGKGPGMFGDIGKRTKDLLTRDFTSDQKFTVTSSTSSGLTFTSFGNKKGEQFAGNVNTQFKTNNMTVDVKVDTESNIHGVITADEIAKGAKTVFTFTIPDNKCGKIEFQYVHDLFGLATSIGLTSSPVADLSAALGNDVVAVGGELSFDTASGKLSRYSGGIGLTKPDYSAALITADKGDTLKASYCHTVNANTKTTVGAEVSHSISKKQNTFTIGALYVLDPLTAVKARLNNHGQVGALLQHEWRPKSTVTLCGEVDTKALNSSPKIGLAVALKP